MEFFYPNFANDMWRIFGLIFKGDRNAFVNTEQKKFNLYAIQKLLIEKRIGLYDTAIEVIRLNENASDKFLEIQTPTDIRMMLLSCPTCCAIAATGQKAAEEIGRQFCVELPKTGQFTRFDFEDKTIRFFRMPSSSRAYPLALDKKTQFYRTMFESLKIL